MTSITNHLQVPNHFAQDSKLAGVFNELDDNLIRQISEDSIRPKPLLVCSGGTSTQCAGENQWTLDLRDNYQQINVDAIKKEVEIGGGVKMFELINKLSKSNLSFPIGLSSQVGVGYILTGGVSPISRNHGLAIDQIISLKGIWGSGDEFEMSKPDNDSPSEDKLKWKALCGAAPFFAIVTSLKLKVQKIRPIYILEAIANPNELCEWILISENWPNNLSLNWIWGNQINIFVVIEIDSTFSIDNIKSMINKLPFKELPEIRKINGIYQLPNFSINANLDRGNERIHSEVISLIGNKWGGSSLGVIKTIESLMKSKPHKNCYVAAQQLGGATSQKNEQESSFIHRDSIWKPWINGAWTAGDVKTKKKSLDWMKQCWENMGLVCPGVHLAQLHPHLPWHEKEIKAAFGDLLLELQNLKSIYDPKGLLPPL